MLPQAVDHLTDITDNRHQKFFVQTCICSYYGQASPLN